MPSPPISGPEIRTLARPEGVWYLRHAGALARWPVIDADWARTIERLRLAETGPRDERGPERRR